MPADPGGFDLGRILTTLDHHGVEYLVVGGLGARAHGATRPTQDVDFVPRSPRENLDRLADALRSASWARAAARGRNDRRGGSSVLPVVAKDQHWPRSGVPPGPLTPARSMYCTTCRRPRVGAVMTICCRGRQQRAWTAPSSVSLRSTDDIIASKQHADRPKDRDALPELEELRRGQPGSAET